MALWWWPKQYAGCLVHVSALIQSEMCFAQQTLKHIFMLKKEWVYFIFQFRRLDSEFMVLARLEKLLLKVIFVYLQEEGHGRFQKDRQVRLLLSDITSSRNKHLGGGGGGGGRCNLVTLSLWGLFFCAWNAGCYPWENQAATRSHWPT